MARDEAYRVAEQKIEEARRSGAKKLDLSGMKLTELPESLGELTQLQSLDLSGNQLTALPESLGQLTQLQSLLLTGVHLTGVPDWLRPFAALQELYLWGSGLTCLPDWIGELISLRTLYLGGNRLTGLPSSFGDLLNLETLTFGGWKGGNPLRELPACVRRLTKLRDLRPDQCEMRSLPDWIGELVNLETLQLDGNGLVDIPLSVVQLDRLRDFKLEGNPLNPELAAAYREGLDAVRRYLRAKEEAQVVLNEAKLILIGEGEVGKSCLLGALRGDLWEEGKSSTHGIEIKPVKVTDPVTGTEITLNGWDFGGQRVYRPQG